MNVYEGVYCCESYDIWLYCVLCSAMRSLHVCRAITLNWVRERDRGGVNPQKISSRPTQYKCVYILKIRLWNIRIRLMLPVGQHTIVWSDAIFHQQMKTKVIETSLYQFQWMNGNALPKLRRKNFVLSSHPKKKKNINKRNSLKKRLFFFNLYESVGMYEIKSHLEFSH